MKKGLLLMIIGVSLFFANSAKAAINNVYLFYGDGCPHCAKEELFLADLKKEDKYKDLQVMKFEVWKDAKNAELLKRTAKQMNLKVSGVPLTVIGSRSIVGFDGALTTGEQIKLLIGQEGQKDVVASLLSTSSTPIKDPVDTSGAVTTKKITAPLIGEIDLRKLSLPILTVVIGLLDSLNPCAMWVLLFLIGILLGMDNRPKMWLLGWTFIGSSAVAYFVFLAAWLNIYQFIKYISWINWAIASVAIAVGLFNLWDFWVNRNSGCDISGSPTKRKLVMDKIKNFALNKSFFVALIGLAFIGAGVNMVELLCSAGLPAVYIPILTLTAKSQFVYYSYIALYIAFYILIQVVVFLVAMFSLKQWAISSRWTRWFGFASGVLMIVIGLFLIFKPTILSIFS